MSRSNYRSDRTRTMVAVGVFAALAYVCCAVFHFKAGFLSFDLKDAVMAVAAMLFGPLYGLAMVIVVSLIEFVTISTTEVYGLIMNIISSSVFVCVGSLIYSRKRDLAGAVIGMAASIVATVAVMMGANLVLTPLYMGVSMTDVAKMIPTVLLPFNLTKTLFNASLVFIFYKPLSGIIRAAGFMISADAASGTSASTRDSSKKSPLKSRVIIIIAAAVAALTLVYFFVKLSGSFSFM